MARELACGAAQVLAEPRAHPCACMQPMRPTQPMQVESTLRMAAEAAWRMAGNTRALARVTTVAMRKSQYGFGSSAPKVSQIGFGPVSYARWVREALFGGTSDAWMSLGGWDVTPPLWLRCP